MHKLDVLALITYNYWATDRILYVASLDDARLNSVYTYQVGDGPKRRRLVWQTIMHVVNHGTQHRSETAAMLTGYGSSPGELDFNLFIHEHPEFVVDTP